MRVIALLIVLLCACGAWGQVMVNGVVPGDLWRTADVSGEVEVFHVWGRTAVVPVRGAWVNIDGDRISIGATCDDPVIDGEPRKGYMMADMSGKLDDSFKSEFVQTISSSEICGVADDQYICTMKTAMVTVKDGKPVSLIFTATDFARFDVEKRRADIRAYGGFFEKRELESLEGFDAQGFRQRVFRAVFK